MRVRSSRMNQHYNESTYRAIEAENHRATEPRFKKTESVNAPPAIVDERDPIEMARAAGAALKGSIAA